MKFILAFAFVLFSISAARSDTISASACDPTLISTLVEYEFKDLDVRQEWVYRSLGASASLDGHSRRAQGIEVKNGRAIFIFCLPPTIGASQIDFHFGPRSISIEPRPIIKDKTGQMHMAPIYLISQPRPTWVIIKSATRISSPNSAPLIFELELHNFGVLHAGGDVTYLSQDLSGRCAFPSQPNRVTVNVAIAGQRLRVLSNDPEYAEELISREANLEQNANQCAGNFKLAVSLGKTGRLQPGPVRIRYGFREAGDQASPLRSELAKYFMGTKFQFRVIGDDIWSSDNLSK